VKEVEETEQVMPECQKAPLEGRQGNDEWRVVLGAEMLSLDNTAAEGLCVELQCGFLFV
jgi:hypothetical protein